MKHLDLGRRFLRLANTEIYARNAPLGWNELLLEGRVIVLGEAFSGKTAEFEAQNQRLRGQGRFTFLLTFRALGMGFRTSLHHAEQRLFEKWEASREPGWIFLDALDEAPMGVQSLDQALGGLANDLGPELLGRAHILISCRSSEWNEPAQSSAISSALHPFRLKLSRKSHDGTGNATVDIGVAPLLVRLAPLDGEQRNALIAWSEIPDSRRFILALEQAGFSVLAERPGDLLRLAFYWRSHRRLASYEDTLDEGVTTDLSPRGREDGALPASKARVGAERLAAALSLTQRMALSVLPADTPTPDDAINPVLVLDDWTDAERRRLLASGLFVSTVLGTVQFRHISVQRFLAGKWFDSMVRAGRPAGHVLDVLFPAAYGVQTIAAHLREVAAWLALWQPRVLKEVLRRDATLLLAAPFVSRLPEVVKLRMWADYVGRHTDPSRIFDPVSENDVMIIADPVVEPVVRESWPQHRNGILGYRILMAITKGTLQRYRDLVSQVALDTEARELCRMEAIKASAALGDDRTLHAIAHELLTLERDSYSMSIGVPVFALYPRVFSRMDVVRFLEKQARGRDDDERRRSVRGVLRSLCEDSDIAVTFIDGLLDDIGNEAVETDERPRQLARSIIEPLIGDILFDLQGRRPADGFFRLVTRLETERHRPQDRTGVDLEFRVADNIWLNQHLLWKHIRRTGARPGLASAIALVELVGDHLWRLNESDLEWLGRDVFQRPNEGERKLALSLVVAVLSSSPEIFQQAETLLDSVAGNAELEAHLLDDLRTALSMGSKAPKTDIIDALKKERLEYYGADPEERWRTLAASVRSDPDALRDRSEAAADSLYDLTDWLARKFDLDQDLVKAARHWRELGPFIGEDGAKAYHDALCAYWRHQVPTQGTIRDFQLPLIAFAVERAESPDWADKLTASDLKSALKHLCSGSIIFTRFLSDLIEARPAAAIEAVVQKVQREWTQPNSHTPFLGYLAETDELIESELIERIANLVSTQEARDFDRFRFGTLILQRVARNPSRDVLGWAKERFHKHSPTATARLKAATLDERDPSVLYLLLVLQARPAEGINLLRSWLRSVRSKPLRSDLAEYVFGSLFGARGRLQSELIEDLTVLELKELLGLFLDNYDRQGKSLNELTAARPGEEFSSSRHRSRRALNANAVGGTFLVAFFQKGGREARDILLDLESEKRLIYTTSSPARIAETMIARESVGEIWDVRRFLAFEADTPVVPKTGDELFRVVLAHLDDIISEFSFGDASLEPLLSGMPRNEAAIQEWMFFELDRASAGRFRVSREEQVKFANRPDLIVSTATAEVAIEIKQADSWTSRELMEALQCQLADDYLLPRDRRHGILAVTLHKPRTWRHPETGQPMSFPKLIEHLTALAAEIRSNASGEIWVAVRAFDVSTVAKKRRTHTVRD